MRKFFGILLLTVSFLGFFEARPASGFLRTFFNDNFDNTDPWIFPAVNGWQLLSNGSGNDDQFVDILHCVSHHQSLRLEGSTCWGAFAYHEVPNMSKRVSFEANVYLDPNVSCGCGPALAELAFFNPTPKVAGPDARGKGYAGVSFNCDGYIYGGDDNDIEVGGNVRLMPYHPNTWYKIRVDLDMDKRLANYYVDGSLKASGIQLDAAVSDDNPKGVVLVGGFSINNPVWYDDVCVTEMLSLYPLIPSFYGTARLSTDGLLTIPFIEYTTLAETISLWADLQSVTECRFPEVCFKMMRYGSN
jgi:hypothetical protein